LSGSALSEVPLDQAALAGVVHLFAHELPGRGKGKIRDLGPEIRQGAVALGGDIRGGLFANPAQLLTGRGDIRGPQVLGGFLGRRDECLSLAPRIGHDAVAVCRGTVASASTPAARLLWLQYADTGVFLAALGTAAWLLYKKRSRRGIFWLSLFSLAYFGFYRNGCICPIGSPQNVVYGLFNPDYAVPVTALVFCFAPIVVALFAGRAFCAGVCPHGALQDFMLIKPLAVPPVCESLIPFGFVNPVIVLLNTSFAVIVRSTIFPTGVLNGDATTTKWSNGPTAQVGLCRGTLCDATAPRVTLRIIGPSGTVSVSDA